MCPGRVVLGCLARAPNKKAEATMECKCDLSNSLARSTLHALPVDELKQRGQKLSSCER